MTNSPSVTAAVSKPKLFLILAVGLLISGTVSWLLATNFLIGYSGWSLVWRTFIIGFVATTSGLLPVARAIPNIKERPSKGQVASKAVGMATLAAMAAVMTAGTGIAEATPPLVALIAAAGSASIAGTRLVTAAAIGTTAAASAAAIAISSADVLIVFASAAGITAGTVVGTAAVMMISSYFHTR